MQSTATSFAMPIRRIFQPVWQVSETVERVADGGAAPFAIRHTLRVDDRAWRVLYEPFGRWVHWAARNVGRLQTGHIRTYLLHSFLTLLLLLWVVT
jgi:hypothetical protein